MRFGTPERVGAVQRTVRKPHTGSRSGTGRTTGTTRRPPPTTPKGTTKSPRAEGPQKWGPAAGDSEDLKEDQKPKAASARAFETALRAKAIAGPANRRTRLARGAKTQEPSVISGHGRGGLSRRPRAKPLAVCGRNDATGRWVRGVETRRSPAEPQDQRCEGHERNPKNVGGRQRPSRSRERSRRARYAIERRNR
jgi:hypothetical protein